MRPLASTVAVLAVAVATSCSAPTDRAVVLAASSIGAAVEQAAAAAGLDVAVTTGGSQVLAAQVRAGAPADLVLLADLDLATSLVEHGLSQPEAVASSTLSLVARPGLDAPAFAPMDGPDAVAATWLSTIRLRVVLADEGVPLGDATRRGLATIGLRPEDLDVVSLEDAATSVLAKVESGEADVAVVYTANAVPAADAGRVQHVGVVAGGDVVVTTYGQWATDLGRATLAALRSEPAQAALRAAGFVPAG